MVALPKQIFLREGVGIYFVWGNCGKRSEGIIESHFEHLPEEDVSVDIQAS